MHVVVTVRCDPPVHPDNTELVFNPGEYALGSSLLYQCTPRHELTSGALNVTCQRDGHWSARPVCESEHQS